MRTSFNALSLSFAFAAACGVTACAEPASTDGGGEGDAAREALALPYVAAAATRPELAAGRALGCDSSGHGQFDFWLGDWNITQPDGSPGGVSNIRRELDGCAVMESYQGGNGRSLNLYDRARGRWTQTYIDGGGLLLRLAGGLDASGAMVMEDDVRTTPSGRRLKDRITWAPRADGAVQQTWRQSVDGGATYATVFDGTYRRAEFTPPPVTPSAVCNEQIVAFREADFLVGTWSVRAEGGGELGRATLRAGAGGCLVEEDFAGPGGYASRAFLAYDRLTRTWYRAQGDNAGTVYELGGSVGAGEARLEGEALPGVRARLTWSAQGPNRLRQRWELSRDGGATWAGAPTLVFRRLAD
jgi:hypothetical protein